MGHIRISAEIKVDLKRIANPDQQDLHAGGHAGDLIILGIADRRRKRLRKQHLLRKTEGKHSDPPDQTVRVAFFLFGVAKLRDQHLLLRDRSHGDLRKKDNEQNIFEYCIPVCFSPISIDQIPDLLESEKTDSQRNEDIPCRDRESGQIIQRGNKKIQILHIQKHQNIGRNTEEQTHFFRVVPGFLNEFDEKEIDPDIDAENEKHFFARIQIKKAGSNHKKKISHFGRPSGKQEIQDQKDR